MVSLQWGFEVSLVLLAILAGHSRCEDRSLKRRNQTNAGHAPTSGGSQFKKYETSCGLYPNKRIVGRGVANRGDWPWMASLMMFDKEKNKTIHHCGGSVISDRYILTAAHCLNRRTAKDVIVRLGEFDFYEESNQNRIDIAVSEIIVHKEFDPNTYSADIALLKLDRQIDFNGTVPTVCLPENKTFLNLMATVIGWGAEEFGGNISTNLQQLRIPVWSNEECDKVFKSFSLGVTVYDSFLCAGGEDVGARDSCRGNSGGPLMIPNANKQWSIIGVVSFGYFCGQKGLPAIYTRTNEFKQWIFDNAV